MYFDIRGRAEPIRLLLEYVGAQYTDLLVTSEDWADTTPTLGDFAAFYLSEGVANQNPKVLQRFGALKKFHEHFARLPRIKEYLSSSRRPAALFYGPNGKVFPRGW